MPAKNDATGSRKDDDPILYPCEPEDCWKFLSPSARYALGRVSMTCFSLSFLSVPLCIVFFVPWVWRNAPVTASTALSVTVLSLLVPVREWKPARKIGQLWYEVLKMSSNLSPETRKKLVARDEETKFIICMHPHGIIPFQGALWSAYCDQYLRDDETGKCLYGFGAAADIVMFVPFLRNWLGWIAAGSAAYKVLKNGLETGKVSGIYGRIPRHLYILPGGVAEIFVSTPGKHCIIFKRRRGIIKLALETGAEIVPSYVFGGTDFFDNFATADSFLARVSHRLRAGVVVFYGRFGLPIPYTPRVTLVFGEPIKVPCYRGEEVPKEVLEEYHTKYMDEITKLFDKYKAVAGYPDATLEIL